MGEEKPLVSKLSQVVGSETDEVGVEVRMDVAGVV